MSDCVFCDIAAGKIPVELVYEDDTVVAFKDLHPQTKVHVLIIPREHHANIGDGIGEKEMGKIFSAVPKVAHILGIDESGYRIIVNTGADAGQTVFHMHIHVLGGNKMPERMIVENS